MSEPFANMTEEEAERFMKGNTHPMREVAAELVGNRWVFDLGCGKGIGVSSLYKSTHYMGVDCSEELIKIAIRDNPDYLFIVNDIHGLIDFAPDNSFPVGVMVSVLEHMESLEAAQRLYNEARRVCEELLVGWHTPPHYSATEIIQVQAELSSPINQNHYKEGSFHGAVQIIPVLSGELWVICS
jgi:SAM-dependent methyltransferase